MVGLAVGSVWAGCSQEAPDFKVTVQGGDTLTDQVTVVVEVTDAKGCESLVLDPNEDLRGKIEDGRAEIVVQTAGLAYSPTFEAQLSVGVLCEDTGAGSVEAFTVRALPAERAGSLAEYGLTSIKAYVEGRLVGCSPDGLVRSVASVLNDAPETFEFPCVAETEIVQLDGAPGGFVVISPGSGGTRDARLVRLEAPVGLEREVTLPNIGPGFSARLGVEVYSVDGITRGRGVDWSDGVVFARDLGPASEFAVEDFAGFHGQTFYFVSPLGEIRSDTGATTQLGVARAPGSSVFLGPSSAANWWVHLVTPEGDFVVLDGDDEVFRAPAKGVSREGQPHFAAAVTLEDGSVSFVRGSAVTALTPASAVFFSGNDSNWVAETSNGHLIGVLSSYAVIPAGFLDAELLLTRPSAPGSFEARPLVLARPAGREDLLQIDVRELLEIAGDASGEP